MKKRKYLLIFYLSITSVILNQVNAAICTALGNGDWSTAANWSCGSIPNCGDLIIIPSTITVTITSNLNYTGCGTSMTISIYGTLKFTTGSKIRLPCNSALFIHAGGIVQPGGGGGSSNLIEICSDNVWTASTGTLGGPTCLPTFIPGCSTLLPIELLNFNAENQDTKAALTWATATEKNTNYFYIERSIDALNWEKIQQVKATENSSKTLYYETDDNEPLFGNSYYRLKINDLDNSFSYSPIKSIYRTKKEAFVVFYPNPTIGIVNLSSSYSSNQIKFKIFDVTGKELTVNITNQTDDKITFDFSTLAKGLYFINVSAHDGTEFSSNRIILK